MELADSLRSQLVLSMAIHALIDGLTSLAFLFPSGAIYATVMG